jgi:hypothetical protein
VEGKEYDQVTGILLKILDSSKDIARLVIFDSGFRDTLRELWTAMFDLLLQRGTESITETGKQEEKQQEKQKEKEQEMPELGASPHEAAKTQQSEVVPQEQRDEMANKIKKCFVVLFPLFTHS